MAARDATPTKSKSMMRRKLSRSSKGNATMSSIVTPASMGNDPHDEKVEQILALLQTGDVDRIKKKLLLAPFTVHLASSASGNTPIHIAARRGDIDVLNAILHCQPKLDVKNKAGDTPVHLAAKASNYLCLKILTQRKVDLSLEDSSGRTALSTLLETSPSQRDVAAYCDALRCLLELLLLSPLPKDPSAPSVLHNADGELPLHIAARAGNEQAIKVLLELDVHFEAKELFSVDAPSLKGASPLMLAVDNHKTEAGRLLLRYNANPFLRSPGSMSPYDMAIKRKMRDLITLMNEIKHANREGCKPSWVIENAEDDSHLQLDSIRSGATDTCGLLAFFRGLDAIVEDLIASQASNNFKLKNFGKRIKSAVSTLFKDLAVGAQASSWCGGNGTSRGAQDEDKGMNWAWVFHQRLLITEECLQTQTVDHYRAAVTAFVEATKDSDEKVAAAEFVSYLNTHKLDPDNSLIGLVPSEKLMAPYGETMENMYRALSYCGVSAVLPNHKSNSLSTAAQDPQPLVFTDAVLSNRATILEILHRWCQRDSAYISRKDLDKVKDDDFSAMERARHSLNARYDGARCQALYTLLKAEDRVSEIWKDTVLEPGELVITIDHASKKDNQLHVAYCFARYAGHTDGKKISLYSIPEEIIPTEVDLSLVIPFPDSMKQYVGSEEMHKLVENPVEKFIREADALVSSAVSATVAEEGIDIDLFSSTNFSAELRMADYALIKLAQTKLKNIVETITETAIYKETMEDYHVRLKRFNAYLRGYGLFPPARSLAMQLLEHVEPEKMIVLELDAILKKCSTAASYLDDQQLLIFKGEKKRQIAAWWQGLIRAESAAFLRVVGFHFNAVPTDFMSKAPLDMKLVHANKTLLMEVLNHEHDFDNLVEVIGNTVNPILEKYITNSFATIESKLKLDAGTITSLEKAVEVTSSANCTDSELSSWLIDVVQDTKVLLALKGDPSGEGKSLAWHVKHHFELLLEKTQQAINIWDAPLTRRGTMKNRKGKKTQKDIEKFLKALKSFDREFLLAHDSAGHEILTDPVYLTKLIAVIQHSDPAMQERGMKFLAGCCFPREAIPGLLELVRRNLLLGRVLALTHQDLLTPYVEVKKESYRLGKLVGAGGGGMIYKAKRGNTTYALKQCSDQGIVFTSKDEFLTEVSIMSILDHPHVVKCHGANKDFSAPFFVMTMCPLDLEFLLRPSDDGRAPVPLSLSLKLRIAMEIAQGLAYVHSWGLAHRDIKSSNVLMDEEFHCYLTDFGVSRMVVEEDSDKRMSANMGTTSWMAPEMLTGEGLYSQKVDVYSFGILLWEILTRERPYSNLRSFDIPELVINGHRPTVPKDLPKPIKDLVAKCWAQSPEERPSAADLAGQLSRLYKDALGEKTEPKLPDKLPKRPPVLTNAARRAQIEAEVRQKSEEEANAAPPQVDEENAGSSQAENPENGDIEELVAEGNALALLEKVMGLGPVPSGSRASMSAPTSPRDRSSSELALTPAIDMGLLEEKLTHPVATEAQRTPGLAEEGYLSADEDALEEATRLAEMELKEAFDGADEPSPEDPMAAWKEEDTTGTCEDPQVAKKAGTPGRVAPDSQSTAHVLVGTLGAANTESIVEEDGSEDLPGLESVDETPSTPAGDDRSVASLAARAEEADSSVCVGSLDSLKLESRMERGGSLPAVFEPEEQHSRPHKTNSAKTFTLPSSRIKIISRAKVTNAIEVPQPGSRRAAPTRRANTTDIQIGSPRSACIIVSPRSRGAAAREEAGL